MPDPRRATVLVSEPQSFRQKRYLPYMWAILKSECDRDAALAGRIDWHDPIFEKDEADVLLAPYRNRPPDVLGLSCYTWNWDLQCAIARAVKTWNPACLVVAGGPHPDYKDSAFFLKHPYIDAVAVKDGEITFRTILRLLLDGERSLRPVPGLYLPGSRLLGHVSTGAAVVPTKFEHSPYLQQREYFERLTARMGGRFDVIWETTRGCPYSCSFCDWGSATMSKVRQFDLGRLRGEIEWFAQMNVNGIMLADANFGILPRDVELADLLNETRSRYGAPKVIHYSPAKNNPDRTMAIARRFCASGISPVHTFAIQHTNETVLAATDRANISVDKQRQVAKAIVAEEIPTLVQLIIGIPGDTCDLWHGCLTDLMDWGLHDNYQIFDYTLLPNAPAADAVFRSKWEIETIARQIPREGTGQRQATDTDALTPVEIIVASKTYSRDDWAKMKVYAAFIRALHNRGLTRLPAMYLHFTHGVPYREFYDRLIEEHFGATALYSAVLEHFRAFVRNEDALEDLPFTDLGSTQVWLEASRWVFVNVCRDFDRQFDAMKRFLLSAFPAAPRLAGAIDYQRNLMVLPDYDQAAGKAFRMDADWAAYFERARLLTRYEPLAEPAPAPNTMVRVTDAGPALDWTGRDDEGRWLAWLEYTRELERTLSTNFRRVRLEPGVTAG